MHAQPRDLITLVALFVNSGSGKLFDQAQPRDLIALIALLVSVGVGVMQYYLQIAAYRERLFERRLKVYVAVKEYLLAVPVSYKDPRMGQEQVNKFKTAVAASEWLFGADIGDLVTMLVEFGEWSIIEYATGQLPTDKHHKGICDRAYHLSKDANDLFSDYLRLHHDKPWIARFLGRLNRWVDQEQPATIKGRYKA